MVTLIGLVGENGVNKKGEVKKVQQLLNENLHLIPHVKKLEENGKMGKLTIQAIIAYQKNER